MCKRKYTLYEECTVHDDDCGHVHEYDQGMNVTAYNGEEFWMCVDCKLTHAGAHHAHLGYHLVHPHDFVLNCSTTSDGPCNCHWTNMFAVCNICDKKLTETGFYLEGHDHPCCSNEHAKWFGTKIFFVKFEGGLWSIDIAQNEES